MATRKLSPIRREIALERRKADREMTHTRKLDRIRKRYENGQA